MGMMVGAGAAFAPVYAAAAGAAVVAGLLLLRIPVAALPATGLLVFAILPVNDFPGPTPIRFASPAVFVLLLWIVRRGPIAGRWSTTTTLSVALLAWLLASGVASISPSRSVVWSLAIALSFIVPVASGGLTNREAEITFRVAVWLGIGLSIYGIAEFAISANPIFDPFYAKAPFPLLQKWSTYRITTSLGHPLNNALFFGTIGTLVFARLLRHRSGRDLAAFLLIAVALLLTGSRGALLVMPVPLLLAGALEVRRQGVSVRGALRAGFVIALIASIGAALYAPTLGERAASGEAQSSTDSRLTGISVSLDVAKSHLLMGSGPGTSNFAKDNAAIGYVPAKLVIENSYLQLLISIGVVGLLIFASLLLALVKSGISNDRYEYATALLAAALIIANFNFIEGVRPGIVLVGIIALGCIRRESPEKQHQLRDADTQNFRRESPWKKQPSRTPDRNYS